MLSYDEFRAAWLGSDDTENKKRNKALVERYPFLLPRHEWSQEPLEDYDYEFTNLDDIPKGWKKSFGIQMCEELRDILIEGNYLDKYQVVQVKEKYGCYDSETEVLTEDGWKYFKDLSFEDRIATLNDNGYLEYQKPTDIIAEKYKGKMYRLENRGVSLCVTPNHNLYVAKGSYYDWRNNRNRQYSFELTTPETYFGKDKRFKKGCLWDGYEPDPVYRIKGYEYDTLFKANDPNSGTRHYIDKNQEYDIVPFLKFLGFYVAEGCVSVGSNNKSSGCIAVAYNKLTEEELVCDLLDGIGCDYKQSDYKDNNGATKRIYDRTLGEWLRKECGHGAPNKKVPQFIKRLSPKYIEIFLTYLFIGDGQKTKTANILSTTSKQLSDDVQELLLKCGYCSRCTIIDAEKKYNNRTSHDGLDIEGKHDVYQINWLKLTEIEIDNSKAKKTKSFIEEWINYNGSVYCVSVPNHIIYIRRNGKGVWCGNSLRWYDNGVPDSVWDKYHDWLDKYADLSERTCIICGEPGYVMKTGWICPYCKDCFAKQWPNRDYEEWRAFK